VRVRIPILAAALSAGLASWALAAPPAASSSPPELPLIQGRRAIATVNGQLVTWGAFREALASVHENAPEATKRAKQDPQALLDRLITGKLIVQEARNIGLDHEPAYTAALESFRLDTLQKMVLDRPASEVKKPSDADVRSLYVTRVGVARIDSVLFKTKAEADAFSAAVKGGRAFADAARAAQGSGATWQPNETIKLAEAQTEVAGAIAVLHPGETSKALQVQDGWTVVTPHEVTVPDDPVARKESEDQALDYARLQAVGAYTRDLRKRYAKVDEALLASLDFEAKEPGFARLKTDERVVARVTGQPPITVAEIAKAVEANFFHGLEGAIAKHQVNPRKPVAFDEILVRRLTVAEATRLGIESSADYRERKEQFEDGALFDAFVKRVIVPDVRVAPAEARAYYDAHADSYATPAMLRLDSIAFGKRSDAEVALKKVRDGADFGWLKQNAAGRTDASDVMNLNGGVYSVNGVDPGMNKALANPKDGDARLFSADDGTSYVILVREVFPPKIKPFEEAQENATRQVLNEKLKKSLDDWTKKLRSAYEVKTFVTPAQLEALVKREFGVKA
jgi:hypothetical protein